MGTRHPDMAKAVQMVRAGARASQAARKFGLAVMSVWRACRSAGLTLKRGNGAMHPDMPKAVEMVRAGAKVTEAALTFGFTPPGVYDACHRAGVPLRKPGRPLGARKPLDLKWSRVDWARSNAQIARELGVSGNHVRKVRLRMKIRSDKTTGTGVVDVANTSKNSRPL